MFVCLEPVLGLSSGHAFRICEIEISFLHLLLLPSMDPNPEAAPVWHKFLAKAIMECAYWSENDREHAANVTRTLVFFDGERQSAAALPTGGKLSRHDSSTLSYPLLEVLKTMFISQQMIDLYYFIDSPEAYVSVLHTRAYFPTRSILT
jgi:hypothetical protein